jgi:glutathione reductase (NADPH)
LRFRDAQVDIRDWYSARRLKEDTAAFKVLIQEQTNKILGAHIIGPNAEETINLFALAMRLGLPTNKMRELVPAYPSQAANLQYMLA